MAADRPPAQTEVRDVFLIERFSVVFHTCEGERLNQFLGARAMTTVEPGKGGLYVWRRLRVARCDEVKKELSEIGKAIRGDWGPLKIFLKLLCQTVRIPVD